MTVAKVARRRDSMGMRASGLFLVLLASCATESAALRAADSNVNAPGAGAYYELNAGQRAVGDVKVWSNGAKVEGDNVIVEVGMRLRNNLDTPMTIDVSGCGLEVMKDKAIEVVDDESATTGDTTIAPGGMNRVTLRYTLPAKTDLDKVSGLDFYWRITTADGPVSRSTAFQRVSTNNGYYYSPYIYGGWGYGGAWGAGFGPGWGPGYGLGFGGTYYRAAPRPYLRPGPPRR